MMGVALGEPFVAVADTDDLKALVDAFDGGGADDAVDAGGRPAPDQDCQFAFVSSSCHIEFSISRIAA